MKQKLLFFAFLCNVVMAQSQFQISTLNLTTNDLVYDANTNRLFASIPSSNGSNGNSIGIINPDTQVLLNTVFIGSEPTVLAISDNGEYIYAGFASSGTIRRFNVVNQTADIQFPLGNDSSTGAFFAEDIEVMPGQSSTIAVSRKNIGFSPRHEGVVIFDNDVMRAITTQDHTGSNKIEFKDNTSLFGYNNESTEFGLRRLAVNAGGVTQVSVSQNILTGFGIDFFYANNNVYGTDGKVVNVTSTPFVAGQFSNVSGPGLYDSALNLVCYVSASASGNMSFKMFNPNTYLVQETVPITQAFGTPKSIVQCGNGCWAFNTSDNKVVIIKNPSLSVADYELASSLELYPNPTSGRINLKSVRQLETVHLFDIEGRQVSGIDFIDNAMNLERLNSGVYVLKVTDSYGTITNKRIIKN